MSGVGIVSERGGSQEAEGERNKELVRPTIDEELPRPVQDGEEVLVVFRHFTTVVLKQGWVYSSGRNLFLPDVRKKLEEMCFLLPEEFRKTEGSKIYVGNVKATN